MQPSALVACACFTKVTSAFLCPKIPLQTSGHKSFGIATHKQKRTFIWFILMLLDWAVGWLLRPFVGSLAIAKERVGKGWSQGWGLVITFECGFNMLPLASEALGWEVGGRSIFILFQA